MGIILEFRRKSETASRIIKPADGSRGEIIIFPGVRIERRAPDDTPTRRETPSGRRAQRARKK
jgi:hypothetical protein